MSATPQIVSYKPISMNATASGIDRIAVGNILLIKKPSRIASLPRKRKRAIAYPPGAPSSRLTTIVKSATTTLLRTESSTPVDAVKYAIVSVEKFVGRNGLGH